ncbi:MAG: hypothetical protein IJK52_10685 [Oscillospiraceae bacterium]|nr:hypothetical protein [Oscillospiraceae bacterium]
MAYGETLFHAGVAVLCASGAVGALLVVVFSVTGRRLKKTLEAEYGKKRHG